MSSFTIGTQNLHVGAASVVAIADVIGWQESTAKSRPKIDALDGYATYHPKIDALAAIAISWRDDLFELVDAGERMTHTFRRKVTPIRGFVWVLLRVRATGELVMFVCTHFISGAWSAPRRTTAWRRARWAEHMKILAAFLEQAARVHPVALVGDMNRHRWLRLPHFHHAGTRAIAPYDQLWASFPLGAARRGPKNGSDHHSWTTTVTLSKEKPAVTKTEIYPGADAKSAWHADDHPGVHFDANCGCLHTTEGITRPGYEGGATAPNVTFVPDMKAQRLQAVQHFPIDMSSRALKNLTGGVETNTLNVTQVELVGTCDPKHRRSWDGAGKILAGRDYIYWPDAPDWALRDLAKFMAWCETEHGIPLEGPINWVRYPDSYGFNAPQRFSAAQWRVFKGWCGHQHVPENDHGDPGNINFARLLDYAHALAGAHAAPGPKPPPKPTPKPAPKTPNADAAYEAAVRGEKAAKTAAKKSAWRKIRDLAATLSSRY
jgi:hypothetical protein